MDVKKAIIKPLILTCSVALTACSSGGDGTTTGESTTNISGVAEAPNGVVAQFNSNKPVFLAASDLLFPPAQAAVTGLVPVSTAVVKLIRINDEGEQVGEVLAETVTSITGNYSLRLPTGVSLAGNLIVRIQGNGASMSAMVVDQQVDINPISQYVLDKFVDDADLVLADLPVNDVVTLQGKIEEFDLTASSDISTMLDELEAEVGQFVENQIAIIETTPDDGTKAAAVSGKWHTIELFPGMHDSDPDISGILFGTFALDALTSELSFADGGNGILNFTMGPALLDAWTNYSTSNDSGVITSIYHGVGNGDQGDTFTGMIDAEGTISISFDFEEELESDNNPSYGWRWPPGTIFLQPVANGDTYVSVISEVGVRYETTDTDGDLANDAIDPNKRAGDEVSMGMLLALKEGSNMTESSLNGNFGMVALNINVDTAPASVFDSTVGVMNFNNGTTTIGVNAFDVQKITRTPATPPLVTLLSESVSEPAAIDSFLYTVTPNGQVTLDPNGDSLEGYANSSGTVLAFVDDETVITNQVVTNVNQEMLLAVKLGTNMQRSVDSSTYTLYPLASTMEESGYFGIFTLGNGSVVFNADATLATIDGTDRGFGRASDVAEVEAITPSPGTSVFSVTQITGNGEITLSNTDGTFTTTLKGYISADSNMLILRIYGSDSTATDKELGMLVGIKQ